MKNCTSCGAQLADNANFCTACGTKLDATQQPSQAQPQGQDFQQNQQPGYQQNPQPAGFQPVAPTDQSKTYSILAHIPLLWLIGMFASPEKNNPRVRFNVGQGIIASIVDGAALILTIILTTLIRIAFTITIPGEMNYITYTFIEPRTVVSPVGICINAILWIAWFALVTFFAVYGIVKASKDSDATLPIIGKFAFYK